MDWKGLVRSRTVTLLCVFCNRPRFGGSGIRREGRRTAKNELRFQVIFRPDRGRGFSFHFLVQGVKRESCQFRLGHLNRS